MPDGVVTRINTTPVVLQLRDKLYRSKTRAYGIFRNYDVNGDGYLSHKELSKALTRKRFLRQYTDLPSDAFS